jgi:hypothetical protein
MKTSRTAAGIGIIAGLALLVAGCDSPFKDDGESTPAEDAAVIATYTQTVNQASSSQDTTVAPNVRVDGDGNNVTIIYGDRNSPTVNPAPAPAEEPIETEEPSAP